MRRFGDPDPTVGPFEPRPTAFGPRDVTPYRYLIAYRVTDRHKGEAWGDVEVALARPIKGSQTLTLVRRSLVETLSERFGSPLNLDAITIINIILLAVES